jgi:hypothetical protein
MARRTAREITVDTTVAERSGVLSLSRVVCGQLPALIERGRLTAAEATVVRDQLRGFADMIATGLHMEGDQLPEVRARMRTVVRERGE